MPWRSSKHTPGHRSPTRHGPARQGTEPPLQRLVRLVAEESGVHGFVHKATADQGVVEQAMALTRVLLQGGDIPAQCRELCRRHAVPEPLLRARLWAVASLFPALSAADQGPYEILGVEPTADPATIKSAFRKLCLECHPDLNRDDPDAATRFQRIKAAYDMVSEPAAAFQPPAGACVWEEAPAPEARPGAWGRMHHLAPLVLVVAVLALTVVFADLLIRRPRSRALPRDVAVAEPTANASVEAPVEGMGREPLTLETQRPDPSGQKQGLAAITSVTAPSTGPVNASETAVDGAGGPALAPDNWAAALPAATQPAERPGGPADDPGPPQLGLADASPPTVVQDKATVATVRDGAAEGMHAASEVGPELRMDDIRIRAVAKASPMAGEDGGASPEVSAPAGGGRQREERKTPAPPVVHAPAEASKAPSPRVPGAPGDQASPDEAGAVAKSREPSTPAFGKGPEEAAVVPQHRAAETPRLEGQGAGEDRAQDAVAGEQAGGVRAGSPGSAPRAAALEGAGAQQPLADAPGMVDIAMVEERLKRFLAAYSGDYSRRDLKSFMKHFTPQAVENAKPLRSLLPAYEENFRIISSMRYSILPDRWILHDDGVLFEGRFSLQGNYADGRPIVSHGRLSMELVPFESTYRVRILNYSFQ